MASFFDKLILGLIAAIFLTVTFVTVFVGFSSEGGEKEGLIVLSDRNTINFNLPIMGGSVKDAQVKMMEMSSKLPAKQPIYLVLNSPGGSVDAGNLLIATAKGLPQPVHTISIFSASMSFVVSQYLDNRYVMDNSVLMSHRAYIDGVSGQIPGNLLTRVNFFLEDLTRMDTTIAARAGLKLEQYRYLTANELWLSGDRAIEARFADKMVRVKCDSSLQGPAEPTKIESFFGDVYVTFHKCPLVTEPLEIRASSDGLAGNAYYQSLFYDKTSFVRDYVETGRLNGR